MDHQGDDSVKKVLLRGPALSKSGYGEHTRQIFRYLLTKNVDVTVQPMNWGITPWYINEKDQENIIGEIISRSTFSPEAKYDISIQVQLPNEWDTSLARYNIGVTAGVETDFTNPQWAQLHCSKMDHVIVPSSFSRKSMLRKGSTQTKIAPM